MLKGNLCTFLSNSESGSVIGRNQKFMESNFKQEILCKRAKATCNNTIFGF